MPARDPSTPNRPRGDTPVRPPARRPAPIAQSGPRHKHHREGEGRRWPNAPALEDPSGLFNSSLEGNTRRAIDFHEGDEIDEDALKALIRAAAALNEA